MSYLSIFKKSRIEIIEKKSLFIARAAPVYSLDQAEAFINSIKEEESNATHNCSCYIIGKDGIRQKYDDDGEPSGTAGFPMLEICRKEDLKNLAVVVSRYFGGIKLGASGLIRIYGESCRRAIEEAKIVAFKPYQEISVEFSYADQGKIDYYMKEYLEIDRTYTEKVLAKYIIPKGDLDKVTASLMDISKGDIVINKGELRDLAAGKDKRPLSK